MSLTKKIELYVSDKCTDLEIFPGLFFRKENIYNVTGIEQLFNLVPNSDTLYNIMDYNKYNSEVNKGVASTIPELNILIRENDANRKYTVEIYSSKLLNNIKKMRKDTFGKIEEDIEIMMIPLAYDKYGLFWVPK